MKHRIFLSLLLLSISAIAVIRVIAQDANTATMLQPPATEKKPKVTEINGDKLVDNYFWLREKTNSAVIAHLEAENAYTDAMMKPTAALQDKLYNEILSHIKQTDVNVPYKLGDYFYYSRTEEGKQYPIFCRKKSSLEAKEEIIIDQNELAKGQKFMALGAYAASDDGNLLAYSTDNTGFRQYTLAVKDLRTGKTLLDHAERVGSVVWANDSQTIFYSQEDAVSKRQYRLYRHIAAMDAAAPAENRATSKPPSTSTEKPRTRVEAA